MDRLPNSNSIISAVINSLILFGTAFLALFQTEGIGSVTDISEATWWIVGGGAAIAFLKDVQAISTRRLIARTRGQDYDKIIQGK